MANVEVSPLLSCFFLLRAALVTYDFLIWWSLIWLGEVSTFSGFDNPSLCFPRCRLRFGFTYYYFWSLCMMIILWFEDLKTFRCYSVVRLLSCTLLSAIVFLGVPSLPSQHPPLVALLFCAPLFKTILATIWSFIWIPYSCLQLSNYLITFSIDYLLDDLLLLENKWWTKILVLLFHSGFKTVSWFSFLELWFAQRLHWWRRGMWTSRWKLWL